MTRKRRRTFREDSRCERSGRQPASIHHACSSVDAEMATSLMMQDKMEIGGVEGLGWNHQVTENS